MIPKERKSPPLQLSEGYRSARRSNSILCALALAWSAAQFDLKTLNFGIAVNIDLSHASIPLILFSAIVYTTARYGLEFAMQPVEVRRWRFAQLDLKISVFLVRSSILILAVSGLDRSVETIFFVILAAIGLIVLSGLAIFIVMMGLAPLLIYLRARRQGGYTSVAARVSESFALAQLIVGFILVILFIALGVASLSYEPLRSLWSTPPSPIALGFFVFTCVLLVVSLFIQHVWYDKLFASPPDYTVKILPDGRKQITGHIPPVDVWDWYIEPVNDDESKD